MISVSFAPVGCFPFPLLLFSPGGVGHLKIKYTGKPSANLQQFMLPKAPDTGGAFSRVPPGRRPSGAGREDRASFGVLDWGQVNARFVVAVGVLLHVRCCVVSLLAGLRSLIVVRGD